MVEFLNKDDAYSAIVQIVVKADDKLVLITPYIKLPADFLERLKDKDKQGLQTVVVCREKELKDDERSELRKLKHLELRFDDDLHAKCFHNEKSMVITSLNLHQHSQQNNREMGILLKSTEDSEVFREALNEAEFIVRRARKDSVMKSLVGKVAKEAKSVIDSLDEDTQKRVRVSSRTMPTIRTKQEGHCIRCGKNIHYDIDKPYCLPCARLWNRLGGNPDHLERHCHQCGKEVSTITYNRPVCGVCYWKNKK